MTKSAVLAGASLSSDDTHMMFCVLGQGSNIISDIIRVLVQCNIRLRLNGVKAIKTPLLLVIPCDYTSVSARMKEDRGRHRA